MSGLSGWVLTQNGQCGKKPSSVKSIHAQCNEHIQDMTYDANEDKWAAISMAQDKYFNPYEFKVGEAEFKVNPVTENGITKYVPTVIFKNEKLTDAALKMIEEIANCSDCGMTWIVETFYNERFVCGFDIDFKGKSGLSLEGGEQTTGRTLTGAQGGDVTVSGDMPNRPRILKASFAIPVAPVVPTP